MATIRISRPTADAIASLIEGMAKSGLLPKGEARAAVCVLHDAAKVAKDAAAPPKAKSGLLTTEQVAERMQCSRKTVLRMADDGTLTRRYLRPGNHKSLRFVEAEVSALCDSGEIGEDR